MNGQKARGSAARKDMEGADALPLTEGGGAAEERGVLAALAQRLGHAFARPELLERALTHSSWANERSRVVHNERQEFLGDAVVELCVSWELYQRFPTLREGDLTRLRARLVSTVGLAERARELGLDGLVRLGRGEELQGGRERDAILSDTLEAVLAAVYEDGGFAAAQKAVARIFAGHWPETARGPQQRDNKSRLQEATQHLYGQTPGYVLASASGPEHARVFAVTLHLPDGSVFSGQGTSCKKAEQAAAGDALASLARRALWP